MSQDLWGYGWRIAAEGDDYRLRHRPGGPEYGAPFHDLNQMWGEDIYDHPEWYDSMDYGLKDIQRQLNQARGNPDHPVVIYRAMPAGITHINTGDWVTTSLPYARQHAAQNDNPDDDWPVVRSTVPAKHVWTNNDLHEWGYHGPHVQGEIVHPGRTAARLAMPAVDAYDKDLGWRNPAPEVPQGKWYHGSPFKLDEGTMLEPRQGSPQWPDFYRGGGGTRSHRADWTWMSPDPAEASRWGKHVYEVEPHDEGPWPWNGPDAQEHRGIEPPQGYVSPRARIVRKLHPEEYEVPSEDRLNAEQDYDEDFEKAFADYQHQYYSRPQLKARIMSAAVTVYTQPNCVQCTMTKKQLDKLGIAHDTVDVSSDPEAHAYVKGLGYTAAPVVVVNDGEDHWSGFRPDRLKGLAE